MAQTIVLRNNPAYKEGSLLGYDLNNQSRFNPVPITLSRDSEARVFKNGVLTRVNPEVPRIDSDGALLVEPQRTNLFTRSEEFDNSDWAKVSVGTASAPVVTANAATAPDGTTTADRIQFSASGGTSGDQSFIRQTISVTAAQDYTITFYVKSNTGTTQQIIFLRDGAISTTVNVTNEWTRIELTHTAASTASTNWGLFLNGNTATSSDILVWGAQIEAGSYATSYIKTEGATATRSADVVSQTGLANLLGDAEGTLYVEASFFDTTAFISLNDGSVNNRHTIYFSSTTNLRSLTTVGGSTEGLAQGTSALNQYLKIGTRYAVNDFAIYLNGSSLGTDTSGSTFSANTLSVLSLDAGLGTNPFYGKIKALAVYDTALDNTELANITTNGI